ncbi:hypothetical protein MSI_05480 [Treponema sp. JC4]|uniref:hypothetical protein n=1 Tax=Treponema sp. JC4 TaxID=1124982 RepID=UPI00025B0A19|nr:hypothetical protein [Treponema sp. JC4]EID85729.1 hypothetical protein MSI_05480 [Treponema sp. JC4]
MNKEEYKEHLLKLGLSEKQIESINFPQLEEIISNAKDVDDICTQLEKIYSGFNSDEFKKVVKYASNQEAKASENVEDLSDENLKEVAGGSTSHWFKDHAAEFAVVAAGIIGGAIWGAATAKDGTIEYGRKESAVYGAIWGGIATGGSVLLVDNTVGTLNLHCDKGL